MSYLCRRICPFRHSDSSMNTVVHHFILTRFNLRLWHKDKSGRKVRSLKWLEHRCTLFERYCLPSMKAQTCQDFRWIVLFDSTTPEAFKDRIATWQTECRQLMPVWVEPVDGPRFAQIFCEQVRLALKGSIAPSQEKNQRVLTTYLDNDDALNVRYVEDVQQRMASLPDGTFLFYVSGYQYFADHSYLMRIRYERNHFVSVVEAAQEARTIYGYGSHSYLHRLEGARIEYVGGEPMWCEVVHEKNMDNDAFHLAARMVTDSQSLRRNFGLQVNVKSGPGIYLLRFLPRYAKTFLRRVKIRLRGWRFE